MNLSKWTGELRVIFPIQDLFSTAMCSAWFIKKKKIEFGVELSRKYIKVILTQKKVHPSHNLNKFYYMFYSFILIFYFKKNKHVVFVVVVVVLLLSFFNKVGLFQKSHLL